MPLYLDTSALIKIYVPEPEADRIRAAIHEIEICQPEEILE